MVSQGTALEITRCIRNDIEAGRLRHGQALPSTRQLAKEWGVSVNTIASALKELIDEGMVVSRDRAGRYVHAPDRRQHEAERPTTPQVVLIGGYAGSGKTELGRMLTRATGWPILDKDTVSRPIVEAALELLGESPNDRESETYLSVVRPAEYEALISAMLENVQCEASAIVTAPFLREFSDQAWLDRIIATTEGLGAVVTFIWVYCDESSMRTYLRRRGAARDSWKLANWETYLSGISLDFRPLVEHRMIDNSDDAAPLPKQATELIEQLTSTASAHA